MEEMIEQWLAEGKTQKWIIAQLRELGFSEPEFMFAIVTGASHGDIIAVDTTGNEIKLPDILVTSNEDLAEPPK